MHTAHAVHAITNLLWKPRRAISDSRRPDRSRARHARRSGPTCPTIGPDMPDVGPDNPDNLPDVGGRDVGHVGSDRRACRARLSGPIVGHVGPDRRACRARSSGMSGTSGPTSGDRRVVGCQKLPFSASITYCIFICKAQNCAGCIR